MATKKIRAAAVAAMVEEMPKVALSPTLVARINQMAHREGKTHADRMRTAMTMSLKRIADKGASHDELSIALASIEKGPAEALADGYLQRLEATK